MLKYNFNKITNRKGSNSVKYDLLKPLFGKADITPMWVADMDFDTPPFILDAIKTRLQHPILGYSYRPESFNDSIIYWLEERHNWKINKTHISFSPGVVPGMLMAMTAVTNPNDKVIVQTPVYFPFFTTIEDNGREMLKNPLKEKDGYYTMDFEHLQSIIDEETKAIFISNPHNPVGRAWNSDELKQLVDICYANNVMILSDEIHSDIIIKPHKHTPIASISEKAAEITITIMAPSKTFNIAGLSTSFVVIQNEELMKKYNKELNAYHLLQGNIFGNVASEAAYSLQGAEWVDEMVDYVSGNIDYVCDFIQENIPKIKVLKPEATYLLWLDMREFGMNNKELADFFVNKAGIAVNQGDIFGVEGEAYVRMNVATSKDVVVEAVRRLEEEVEKGFSLRLKVKN
jgi:cystathionine beta-lyase